MMANKITRWSRGLLPNRREVLLSALIEYSQYGDQDGMYLGDMRHQHDEVPPEILQKKVERIIQERLPADLMDLFGIDAQIKVQGARFGSLLVVFSVLLSGYTLIASYKSFYDSIQLIKEHCQLLLKKLLREEYSHRSFNVSVDTRYPALPNPYDLHPGSRLSKMLGFPLSELPSALWAPDLSREHPRRDGFFWFLLVLCVLLLVALGVLVYAAVVKTYFA